MWSMGVVDDGGRVLSCVWEIAMVSSAAVALSLQMLCERELDMNMRIF